MPRKQEFDEFDKVCLSCHLPDCRDRSPNCPRTLAMKAAGQRVYYDRATPKQEKCGFKEKPEFGVSDLGDFVRAVDSLYDRTVNRKGGFNNSATKPNLTSDS